MLSLEFYIKKIRDFNDHWKGSRLDKLCHVPCRYTMNTWRNNNGIITSKRRFDVEMTLLLHRVSAEYLYIFLLSMHNTNHTIDRNLTETTKFTSSGAMEVLLNNFETSANRRICAFQWRHISAWASQITRILTFCSKTCPAKKTSTLSNYYWPFMMVIHQWIHLTKQL